MERVVVELENAPKGYKWSGIFRGPFKGEWFLYNGKPCQAAWDFTQKHHILEKLPEPKTIKDYIGKKFQTDWGTDTFLLVRLDGGALAYINSKLGIDVVGTSFDQTVVGHFESGRFKVVG